MRKTWDIFCAVVDNFGDIGVCWRLARQLVRDHDQDVRLWVDDLAAMARLVPETRPVVAQQIAGVEVRRWQPEDFSPGVDWRSAPGDRQISDVVVEAFACELPEAYQEALAQATRELGGRGAPAIWINLEYLSAEAWVDDFHRGTSPHPRWGLPKHFFFPGFTPATGGLLRENDYFTRRQAFDPAAFCERHHLTPAPAGALQISLFAYPHAALASLLDALGEVACTAGPAVHCWVPEGGLWRILADYFGRDPRPGELLTGGPGGRLSAVKVPFLPQSEFDGLLWLSEVNFIRGEDSFVRAQWAGKPFIWHIYPQDEAAHRDKMRAFQTRYLAGLPEKQARAVQALWWAWEGSADAPLLSAEVWHDFLAALPALAHHAEAWAQSLAQQPDLARQLVTFVMKSS